MKTIVLAAIVDKKRPTSNPELLAFSSLESFTRHMEASLSPDVVLVNVQVVPVFTPALTSGTDETEA